MWARRLALGLGGWMVFAAAASMSAGPADLRDSASRPADFVDLQVWIPTLVVELAYAGTENFTGQRIDGYTRPRALLTRQAADALRNVQADLARDGYGLKVWDAYRPQRAVAHFVRWAREREDSTTRSRHHPRVPKEELFARGYLALESAHVRGSAVDVGLVRVAADGTRSDVDMGTRYDFFDPRSSRQAKDITADQRAHRERLYEAMRRHGFDGYDNEWWHFTLRDEPFPDTYFDFPIE